MHEQPFPESTESVDQRSERAVAALEYEERRGLGFRRRRSHVGDPYADPERYLVEREQTTAETIGGFCTGIAAVFGGLSLVIWPLLLGTVAAVAGIFGVMMGPADSRAAKYALVVACIGFFFGMIFAISFERPII